jgi:hypothetical protein
VAVVVVRPHPVNTALREHVLEPPHPPAPGSGSVWIEQFDDFFY